MKKLFLGTAIVIGGTAACAPYITGMIMEKNVRTIQTDVNAMYQDSGLDVNIEIVKYNRGYSNSTIDWKVNLGSLKSFYGVEEITFTEEAKHGFLSITSTTSLQENPWYTAFVETSLNGEDPLSITTTYNLNGSVDSTVELKAFTVDIEGESIQIKPATVTSHMENGLTHIKCQAEWDGAKAADVIDLGLVEMAYDLEKVSTYIWKGAVNYSVENIVIEDPTQMTEVTNFQGQYNVDYSEKDNLLSGNAEFSFDKIETGVNSVSDALLKIAVNNINAEEYEQFMEIYTTTMYAAFADMDLAQSDPEAYQKAMEEKLAGLSLQMAAASEKLLKEGLEISLPKIRATLPEGDIKGNLRLQLNQDLSMMQLAPLYTQPALAFDMFSIETKLSFPSALAGENAMMLIAPMHPAMQTGFFTEQGDNLVHEAKTKDGTLILNGKKVDL